MRAHLLVSLCMAGLLFLYQTTLSVQTINSQLPLTSLLEAARAHLTHGELQQALYYYDAVIEKDSGDYLTLFKRALTQLSLGHIRDAKSDLEKVLDLRPGFEGAHVQLARMGFEQSDWAAAKAQFRTAGKTDISPEMTEIFAAERAEVRARAAHRLEQWTVCIDQADQAISTASRSPSLYQLRAWCRLQSGEAESGLSDLNRALQMHPGETDWHITASVIRFYALGEVISGLAESKKCLVFDPDSAICRSLHKRQRLLQRQIEEADDYLRRGQATTASRLLRSVDGKGLLNIIQQQVNEMQSSGKMPVAAGARLYGNVLDLACQAHFQSSHKDASRYCDELLHIRPESFWGLVNQGKTLFRAGHLEAALPVLERCAESWPDKRYLIMPLLQKTRHALTGGKTKDYYNILGVQKDASEGELKAAYRASVKKNHPDKVFKQGISKEEAEKTMASINEAFEILSDPQKRAKYDDRKEQDIFENTQSYSGSPFQNSFFRAGNPFYLKQTKESSSPKSFKFTFHGGGTNPFGNN